MRPRPVRQVLRVNTLLKSLVPRLDLRIQQLLARCSPAVVQGGYVVDGIHGQTEPIRLVADRQLEGSVDVALLLVPTHMQVLVCTRSLVRQSVDKPRVRVEVEDDGLVGCEEGRPLRVFKAVRVVFVADELEEIDDVDAADLEVGEMLQQEVDGGEGLVGGDVSTGGHHQVGLLTCIGGELGPDADSLGAMLDGCLHRKVLEVVLFVGDDDVDVVGGAETVIHAGEKAISVGRQVDADDLGGLICDHIQKAGVLVREAVVILSPHHCGEQDVQ